MPPKQNVAFVCAMERLLAVSTRLRETSLPGLCMDGTTRQCVRETRLPRPVLGARYDAEYGRNGVAHLFEFHAPWRTGSGWT